MIKYFISLIMACSFLVACSPAKKSSKNPGQLQEDGGVDVGNMSSIAVPNTNASLTYPRNWNASSEGQKASLQNKSGSKVEAQKADIKDLVSPNAKSLQQYLKAKYPNREYKIVSMNGMDGVRAELVDNKTEKSSDLYLVSELKDFINIRTTLKANENGITEGDSIVATVRVKYQGVAYENSVAKTITLEARKTGEQKDHERHAYSFASDCFPFDRSVPRCESGVSVSDEQYFKVGLAGYDHGRVIELGSDKDVPFDAIRVDGEYLVAPLSNIPLADIYTAFTPKDPVKDQDRIDLKEGYVYLVRTISWPEEDLITKMRVEKRADGKATLTYQKLVYVKQEELQKQVDAINKYTRENEMPLETGEVVLYDRTKWNNYHFASFNFQYSTSGNMFITRNGWDLSYTSYSGKPQLYVPHTGGALGGVIELGTKDLSQVQETDLPDPNTYSPLVGYTAVEKGHTYAIYHHRYSNEGNGYVFAAVQVLDVGPNNEWLRLKFRRIQVAPAKYFQKWLPQTLPQGVLSVTLAAGSSNGASQFIPYAAKRADEFKNGYGPEDISYGVSDHFSYLHVDPRPYGKKAGFYKVGNNVSLDSISLAEVEQLKNKDVFVSDYDTLQKGDVLAVLVENYMEKVILVMKVDDIAADKSLRLSMKYLYCAKTAYADPRDYKD